MAADHQSLLIYDGSCSFCVARANALARSSQDALSLVPSESIDNETRERLGIADASLDRYLLWIDDSGQIYRGALAVGRAMCAAGGWRAVIGRAVSRPPMRSVATLLYAVISRARRHLPA